VPIRIPVYSEQGSVPRIEIYTVAEDGTFQRSNLQHFAANTLRDNILGIGPKAGRLVGEPFVRTPHKWKTPTVELPSGRPQSICRFLRTETRRRRLFVFTRPALGGRLQTLDLHPLQLRPGMPQGAMALFVAKYLEATNLELEWVEGQRNDPARERAREMAARLRRLEAERRIGIRHVVGDAGAGDEAASARARTIAGRLKALRDGTVEG